MSDQRLQSAQTTSNCDVENDGIVILTKMHTESAEAAVCSVLPALPPQELEMQLMRFFFPWQFPDSHLDVMLLDGPAHACFFDRIWPKHQRSFFERFSALRNAYSSYPGTTAAMRTVVVKQMDDLRRVTEMFTEKSQQPLFIQSFVALVAQDDLASIQEFLRAAVPASAIAAFYVHGGPGLTHDVIRMVVGPRSLRSAISRSFSAMELPGVSEVLNHRTLGFSARLRAADFRSTVELFEVLRRLDGPLLEQSLAEFCQRWVEVEQQSSKRPAVFLTSSSSPAPSVSSSSSRLPPASGRTEQQQQQPRSSSLDLLQKQFRVADSLVCEFGDDLRIVENIMVCFTLLLVERLVDKSTGVAASVVSGDFSRLLYLFSLVIRHRSHHGHPWNVHLFGLTKQFSSGIRDGIIARLEPVTVQFKKGLNVANGCRRLHQEHCIMEAFVIELVTSNTKNSRSSSSSSSSTSDLFLEDISYACRHVLGALDAKEAFRNCMLSNDLETASALFQLCVQFDHVSDCADGFSQAFVDRMQPGTEPGQQQQQQQPDEEELRRLCNMVKKHFANHVEFLKAINDLWDEALKAANLETDPCGICFTHMQKEYEATIGPCGHRLHTWCAEELVASKSERSYDNRPRCPYCRGPLNGDSANAGDDDEDEDARAVLQRLTGALESPQQLEQGPNNSSNE